MAIKDLLYLSIARSSKWRWKLRWRLFAVSLNDERQRTPIAFSLFYFQCYGRLLSFERIIIVIGRNFLASHMLCSVHIGCVDTSSYRVDASLGICFNYVFDMTLYRIYSIRIVSSLRRERLIENYNQLVLIDDDDVDDTIEVLTLASAVLSIYNIALICREVEINSYQLHVIK